MYMTDQRRPQGDEGISNKVLISSYNGTSFVAEREGELLNIYMMSSGNVSTNANVSNVPGTMADKAGGPMTPSKLQRIIEASRRRA